MKVLMAVDDPIFGEAMARFVAAHQWPPMTHFKVVHVVSPVLMDHQSVPRPLFLESVAADLLSEARALVRHVALKLRDAFRSPYVEEAVLEGRPAERILAEIDEWGADVVVLGSHGRRGVTRFVVGSVSQAVVAHAGCSALVVRLPAGTAGAGREQAAINAAGIKE